MLKFLPAALFKKNSCETRGQRVERGVERVRVSLMYIVNSINNHVSASPGAAEPAIQATEASKPPTSAYTIGSQIKIKINQIQI